MSHCFCFDFISLNIIIDIEAISFWKKFLINRNAGLFERGRGPSDIVRVHRRNRKERLCQKSLWHSYGPAVCNYGCNGLFPGHTTCTRVIKSEDFFINSRVIIFRFLRWVCTRIRIRGSSGCLSLCPCRVWLLCRAFPTSEEILRETWYINL